MVEVYYAFHRGEGGRAVALLEMVMVLAGLAPILIPVFKPYSVMLRMNALMFMD